MKGVQCYELFGGIALKIHTFSFFFYFFPISLNVFGIVAVVLDSLKPRHHGKVPYPRRGRGLNMNTTSYLVAQ